MPTWCDRQLYDLQDRYLEELFAPNIDLVDLLKVAGLGEKWLFFSISGSYKPRQHGCLGIYSPVLPCFRCRIDSGAFVPLVVCFGGVCGPLCSVSVLPAVSVLVPSVLVLLVVVDADTVRVPQTTYRKICGRLGLSCLVCIPSGLFPLVSPHVLLNTCT